MSLAMRVVDSPALSRLGLESAGVSLTPEEFDAITDHDEDYNYELIHGVLVVSPLAGPEERSPNELLGYWLNRYRFECPTGAALIDTLYEEYLPTSGNRRRADRVIWSVVNGRPQDPKVDLPAIAIEFRSAGRAAWRRDYLEKRDEYLSAGIIEYWVVDRFARTLTAFTLRDGQPTEVVVEEGDIYRTALLPGFELPLAELLAAADRWSGSA